MVTIQGVLDELAVRREALKILPEKTKVELRLKYLATLDLSPAILSHKINVALEEDRASSGG